MIEEEIIKDQRKRDILKVIEAATPGPAGPVTLDTSLSYMGYDSLEMLTVVDAVETHFNIQLSDEKLSMIVTLGDMIAAIEEAID